MSPFWNCFQKNINFGNNRHPRFSFVGAYLQSFSSHFLTFPLLHLNLLGAAAEIPASSDWKDFQDFQDLQVIQIWKIGNGKGTLEQSKLKFEHSENFQLIHYGWAHDWMLSISSNSWLHWLDVTTVAEALVVKIREAQQYQIVCFFVNIVQRP